MWSPQRKGASCASASRGTAKKIVRIFRSILIRYVLVDPDAKLIRAVGAENEGHWAGLIAAPVTYVVDSNGKVRWAYVSSSAADRPSPVGLARAAVAIARGEAPPADYPGKS